MKTRLEKKLVRQFILGGRAVLTVKNNKTGRHKTYRICKGKERVGQEDFWVSIRGDQDSLQKKDRHKWLNVGVCEIKPGRYPLFKTTRLSQVSRSSVAFKGFAWLIRSSYQWEIEEEDSAPFIEVFHEGRCGRCGRALTSPESIRSGFGPNCIKKI